MDIESQAMSYHFVVLLTKPSTSFNKLWSKQVLKNI